MTHIFHLIIFSISNLVFIEGVHFLGGTISWRPLNTLSTGSSISIVITQTYSWTYGVVICTPSMIVNNSFVIFQGSHTALDTTYLNCISNCPTSSPGYIAPLIRPHCTDISAPIGTIVGQRSDIVNLTIGDDFVVAFQAAAWRSLKQGSSASWSISSRINLKLRLDNGLYNNAPVATMMSPINIPVNETKIITIPIGDADGDYLRCRWATQANGIDECGNVCPPSSLPVNTIIYPNCTIIITGELVGDWHAVTVIIEDFLDSSSNTSLSAVPVQFLVQVISPPVCTNPPKIIGLPMEDSCTPVTIGQTFISQIIATTNCGSTVNISDIATLSFAGFITSDLDMFNSTMFYKNLTWIPTINQLGYQLVCTMAIDSQNSQSSQYCFKFYVSSASICACPGYVCSTTAASTTFATTTIKPIDWPLIGTIIGLTLLGALALSCFLCWYCLCPPSIFRWKLYEQHGPPELYHIERCMDPNCQWLSQKTGSIINLYNNDQESSIADNHSTLTTHMKPLIYLSDDNRLNVNSVRIIQARSHLPIPNQLEDDDMIRPSIIENTIQLDNPIKLPHRATSNLSNVSVTRVPTCTKHSSQSVRSKQHLRRKLLTKISRPATLIIPFDSIGKITQEEKTNEIPMTPTVIVKRLRREVSSR